MEKIFAWFWNLPRRYRKLDLDFYRRTYADLSHLENSDLENHWNAFGRKEKRFPNGCKQREGYLVMRIRQVLFSVIHILGFKIHLERNTNSNLIKNFLKTTRPVGSGIELIRIGGPGDGGYLLPNDLEGITAIYSPGVSDVSDFEFFFAEKDIECYLLDYSVESPALIHNKFNFSKRFLGHSTFGHFVSLSDWLRENNETGGDLILQMDIEGDEWEILESIEVQTLRSFRIMVVEFHDMANRLFNKDKFEECIKIFDLLLEEFQIVHVHLNNCCKTVNSRGVLLAPVWEVTFLRKDRVLEADYSLTLPHKLDRPNLPNKSAIKVPKQWRKN